MAEALARKDRISLPDVSEIFVRRSTGPAPWRGAQPFADLECPGTDGDQIGWPRPSRAKTGSVSLTSARYSSAAAPAQRRGAVPSHLPTSNVAGLTGIRSDGRGPRAQRRDQSP